MKALLLAGVLAMTALSYSNSLRGQFQFDDVGIQTYVGGKMPAFVEREMGIRHRPLPWLTYRLNFWLGGGNPFVYHLTNLLVHLAAVALVFGIVLQLLDSLPAATFGALIFGIHPFFSSAVSYIYGRTSMMPAMFVFAAIYAALAMTSRWRWPVTALLFACAVASKEEALLAPVFVLGYAVIHRHWRLTGAMLATGICGAAAAMWLAPQVGTPFNTELVNPVWDLVLNYGPGLYLGQHLQAILNGYVFHILGNLLLPLGLTPDPTMVYGGFRWLISIAVLLGIAVLALLPGIPRGFRYGCAALLACPVLGALVILLAEPLFEYRAYMMGLGVALIAGTTFHYAWNWIPARSMVAAFAGLLVGVLIMGTAQRNTLWASPIPLWEDAHRKDPLKKRPILNLSAAYIQRKRFPEAERILLDALEKIPNFRAANVNLAAVYIESNDCDRGDYYARRGVPVAIAYSYIALCQLHDQHYSDALANAETSMRVDPTLVYAHEIQLGVLASMGKGSEQVTVLEAEAAAKPKDQMTHIRLAIAYRLVGANPQADAETKIAQNLK